MGYVLPYYPDSYLLAMKRGAMVRSSIGQVEPVQKKELFHHLHRSKEEEVMLRKVSGKGIYFDRFV